MNETVNRELVEFVEPVLGFENCRRWALLARPEHLPFLWLQSVDRPTVALPLADPNLFVRGYAPASPRFRGPDWRVFCVVSRRQEGLGLNLAAPILISTASGRAAQVVLDNPGYPIFHPLQG